MKDIVKTASPCISKTTSTDLPDGLIARLWIEPRCFFSSGRADDSCWLWLLQADGRIHALHMARTEYGQDDRLASLLIWLNANPVVPLQDDRQWGTVHLLSTAPVVPTLNWSISWGHPIQKAIRQFAGMLNQPVLNVLGQLEVPGAYFGSISNYNRLACLPAAISRHRVQALDLFPPLVAPLLLDGCDKPDIFSGGTYSEIRAAHFSPTDKAPVLEAMDNGRDLIGALAHYWRIDQSLVRAPLCRTPWKRGRIARPLLSVLNAMPAHQRPRTREAVEPWWMSFRALPVYMRSRQDIARIAGLFSPGWNATWRQLDEAYPVLANHLQDSRDFLRAALDQINWIAVPNWLDVETLALGWLSRRGIVSLLEASQRWHEQPLTELAMTTTLPDELPSLLGTVETRVGTATELTTRQVLQQEGANMHHCVGDYWRDCLARGTRIMHLELADGSVATAQYDCRRFVPDPQYTLVELRGRCNESASQAMWAFARTIATKINGANLREARMDALQTADRLHDEVVRNTNRQTIRLLDRRSRNELHLVAAYCLKQPDWRDRANVLYKGIIAGFNHAARAGIKHEMRVGDALTLIREPDNPHDPQAIRIDWAIHKVGYIPRHGNTELAALLDAGKSLRTYVFNIHNDNAYAPVECVVQLA